MEQKRKHINLTRSVVESFKEKFLHGEIHPGETLPSERELAEQMNVSRTTIREAIIALKVMGLIEMKQGKRATVKAPSVDSVIEILSLVTPLDQNKTISLIELREIFEPPCVGLATQKATTQDLQEIKKSLDDMDRSADNHETFFKADYEFHRNIMLATHNDMIVIFYTIFIPILRSLAMITLVETEETKSVFEAQRRKHEKILQAMSQGDAELAGQSVQELITETKNRYMKSIFTVHSELDSPDRSTK